MLHYLGAFLIILGTVKLVFAGVAYIVKGMRHE